MMEIQGTSMLKKQARQLIKALRRFRQYNEIAGVKRRKEWAARLRMLCAEAGKKEYREELIMMFVVLYSKS